MVAELTRPWRITRPSSRSSRSARATRAARSGRRRSPTTSTTDEDEPEVLFDGLHHAREHLTVEQALAILRWLTDGYGDATRGSRASSIAARSGSCSWSTRTAASTTSPARRTRLAQEPPAERGDDRRRHRPQPQLRLPLGVLRRLIGHEVVADTYRGPSPFSAPEARAVRDFTHQPGRRWSPADQGRDHVPRRGRAGPLAVRLHEDRRAGRHDRRRPGGARAIGRKMAAKNGYTPKQSSALYVTDGDEIDWAYGRHKIFMYTFELYPAPRARSRHRPVLPARRDHRARDRAKQDADPLAHRAGPAAATGSSARRRPIAGRSSTTSRSPTGWARDPHGTDTAHGRALGAGEP